MHAGVYGVTGHHGIAHFSGHTFVLELIVYVLNERFWGIVLITRHLWGSDWQYSVRAEQSETIVNCQKSRL